MATALARGAYADQTHIAHRDEDRADQCVIVGRGMRHHPAAHAVPGERDALGIDAEFGGVGRIAQIRQNRVGIFKVLRESK